MNKQRTAVMQHKPDAPYKKYCAFLDKVKKQIVHIIWTEPSAIINDAPTAAYRFVGTNSIISKNPADILPTMHIPKKKAAIQMQIKL